ncbi:MAG: imidazoleglycerol-phosphate dehydratase [Methanocellales archaeon]
MRTSQSSRKTNETQVKIKLNLDGTGVANVETGIHFFDNLLKVFAASAKFDLEVKVKGDLETGDHHIVEDTAIVLAQAFSSAIDKGAIEQTGFAIVPVEDSIAAAAVNLDKPYFTSEFEFKGEKIEDMQTENISHFLQTFAYNARLTLHINAKGKKDRSLAIAIFKALGIALRIACKTLR